MDQPKLAKDGTRRGRPEGSMNRLARESREQARATGKLPHEILLDMARGRPVKILRLDPVTRKPVLNDDGEYQHDLMVPTLDEMKDAAKAAAPYYAPKISTVEVLAGASENELDRLIEVLAAEAGVSLGNGSQSETGEAEGGSGEDGDGGGAEHAARRTTGLRKRPITRT